MGMDCERAANAVRQAGGSPPPDQAETAALLEHLKACPDCAGKYAAIAPFLRRDLSGEFFSMPAPSAAATIRAVMSRLPSPKVRAARRFPAVYPAFAASAAVAAALALFIWIGYERASGSIDVRFSLYAPQAQAVRLAADFASWDGNGYELRKASEPGVWEIKVKLKRGKSYLYNFVIDGEKWIPDPKASVILDDGFGNKCSSLSI